MASKVISAYSAIINDIKANKVKPVYILHGEEEFFIDGICDVFESHLIPPDFKDFNQTILYGNEVDAGRIIGECKRFPMMAPYVLVMVKEANQMRKMEELTPYIEKPTPSTVLVIANRRKKLDKRTKFFKASEKHVVFDSEKLRDNAVPEWLAMYLAEKKLKIEPRAQFLLIEYLGSDLKRMSGELEKVFIALQNTKSSVITEKVIEENVGINRDYNIFELQDALGLKQFAKAMTIVSYFSENKKQDFNSIIPAVGFLISFFMKIYAINELPDKQKGAIAALGIPPFYTDAYLAYARNYSREKLDSVIRILHEYDLKSKGINNHSATSEDMYREMVVKIIALK